LARNAWSRTVTRECRCEVLLGVPLHGRSPFVQTADFFVEFVQLRFHSLYVIVALLFQILRGCCAVFWCCARPIGVCPIARGNYEKQSQKQAKEKFHTLQCSKIKSLPTMPHDRFHIRHLGCNLDRKKKLMNFSKIPTRPLLPSPEENLPLTHTDARPCHNPSSMFHPIVEEWFRRRFGAATEPQSLAWPEIQAGRDVLISAPTGSGKTLAAFLICIDRLITLATHCALRDQVEVIYVSPLKALSNDIQKNLDTPLMEIAAVAGDRGVLLPPLRTAVRTGDTPAKHRRLMLERPPHILVTTPESLYILLTARKSRVALGSARTVIVDEIHAIADDKRGAHLALSLARLDDLVLKSGGVRPQRIGLSATVNPIEEIVNFLEGTRSPCSPGPRIIHTGHRRPMHLAVEVPRDELGPVSSNEMWSEMYDRLAELIRSHRTTLVFVNTRRLAERVAHHLSERLGENCVLAHHGSLSRDLRLMAEARLKRGELRAVVATASLELGIDIGSVDLVCQIGSPRAIGIALQRIGRSGHAVDLRTIPNGKLFATTRDELIECAALVRAIRQGRLDRLQVPPWPRDILAQQIVAATAAETWSEDELFELCRRAYPYRQLPRNGFDAILAMLSEGIATRRGRRGAFLHRDRVHGTVTGRRGARLAAITCGGAIPENANYLVVAEPEGTIVGTLDEDFAVESLAGDIFLLGTTSWRIRRVEPGRVRVEDAHGAPPSVPFWRGEAPGRTAELSYEVASLREQILRLEPSAAVAFLKSECGLDRLGAEQAELYVRAGAAALSCLPSSDCVVAERFFDESGGMQLVLHAPFGARINRAWGLALRKRFCRSFNLELQAAATDNGIVISLSDQHSFPLDAVFEFLNPATVKDILTQALLQSPIFTARWRWNATRALAVLRFSGGRRVPPPIQRMRSDDLLASVFPDQAACGENLLGDIRVPDHPLVEETLRDGLHEAMDLDALISLLEAITRGEVRSHAVDTAEPSPFSHEILNANPYAYLDDAPLEERRARAVQMRRSLGPESAEIGMLDPDAIKEIADESWPVVRDRDELHDALMTLIVIPSAPEWTDFFNQLQSDGRAAELHVKNTLLWVPAERLGLARIAYPEANPIPQTAAFDRTLPPDRGSAIRDIVCGWLESIGPTTASDLAAGLTVPGELVDQALLRLEGEGQVLRGKFTEQATKGNELEWCNRRVLARIHRRTLGRLRREIQPVSAADFVRFLFRWQHVSPHTQLHGTAGTLEILRQLQGYEISAAAWEREILSRRIADYKPAFLDELCFGGHAMWGRLSRHPALRGAGDQSPELRRRIRPTRVAPVSIFLRDDAEAMLQLPEASEPSVMTLPLSASAQQIAAALAGRGASFVSDLVRSTGRSPGEVEDALWELTAAGLVTADGFDNLRALLDPKRFRPRSAMGRWALLRRNGPAQPAADRVEAFARQLLLRWGVVFRDLLAREALAPAWRDLLLAFRLMEARGEIRGGRFVSGFLGEQFARPEALDALRAGRRAASAESIPLRVSAADPLNLIGILTPGLRVSPLSGLTVEMLQPPLPRRESVAQSAG
jgi:ATP-dependent Lhr-like helicase